MPRRSREGAEVESRPVLKRGRYSLRMTRSRAKRQSKLSKETEGRVNIISDEDFKSKFKVLEVESKPSAALQVVFLDLLPYKNRREHHTKEYDQPDLILRRGQAFAMTIEFDREIDMTHDMLILQFTYGDQPKESKGSLVRIPVVLTKNAVSSDMARCWSASTLDISGKSVTLTLTSPPDICIGKYNMFVETNVKGQDMMKRYKHEDEIIIIFNAWCEDDSVYMKEPSWRKEYVLNEEGKVWVGSQYKNRGRPWNFGQFSEPCLEAALFLLDKGELADSGRNSPVSIIRIISALANSCDDDGVLEGRWTADYPSDCTAPWVWRGSVNILKEFMETGKPVQYGQCWVFSCLTTTLLRALGIPTRSVTNFESAHDTDCSMTIDYHYDEEGSPVDDLNDSKWNFHVWNESWLRRPDLPDGYDGWQAHDATPQELSEGVMRCGPAPLRAIKEGHVYLNYDVNFILSEVNGDRVNWRVRDDSTMVVLSVDKNVVGRNISTKAVGSDLREDLTLQYKYPEGSAEERRVMRFVSRFGTRRQQNIYNLDTKQEVKLEPDLPNETMIGNDFEIKVNIMNDMEEERKMNIRMTVLNAYYTGISGQKVKTEKLECIVPGRTVKTVSMSVSAEEYEKKRNPEGRFQLYVNAKNVSNGRMHVLSEVFMLSTPDLTVEIPSVSPYMSNSYGKVEFKNTTNLTLTHGMFACDAGNGLIPKGFNIPVKKPLKPGDLVTEEFVIFPTRRYHRRRRLNVSFNCDQIVNVEGTSDYTSIINTPPRDDDETDSSDDE